MGLEQISYQISRETQANGTLPVLPAPLSPTLLWDMKWSKVWPFLKRAEMGDSKGCADADFPFP